MTEKTQEQLAAEQAAAEAKAKKEAEAAAKKAEREAKKAEAQAKKDAAAKEHADKKAAKEQEKAAAKAKLEADKKAKEDDKAAAKAAKEANRQPEQNGVRRPGPNGLCGQAWAIFDELSQKLGQPTPIANAMEVAKERGLNEANVRTEYARWKKFYGIAGRVALPAAAPAEGAQAAAQ